MNLNYVTYWSNSSGWFWCSTVISTWSGPCSNTSVDGCFSKSHQQVALCASFLRSSEVSVDCFGRVTCIVSRELALSLSPTLSPYLSWHWAKKIFVVFQSSLPRHWRRATFKVMLLRVIRCAVLYWRIYKRWKVPLAASSSFATYEISHIHTVAVLDNLTCHLAYVAPIFTATSCVWWDRTLISCAQQKKKKSNFFSPTADLSLLLLFWYRLSYLPLYTVLSCFSSLVMRSTLSCRRNRNQPSLRQVTQSMSWY